MDAPVVSIVEGVQLERRMWVVTNGGIRRNAGSKRVGDLDQLISAGNRAAQKFTRLRLKVVTLTHSLRLDCREYDSVRRYYDYA